jgi:hypothetical protein
MWRPNVPLGFVPAGWSAMVNPRVPWTRPIRDNDPRLNPSTGGGRRLRHPYLDDIVYPTTPNRTIGFDYHALKKTRAAVVRTEGASAVAHYREQYDDVVIQEIWDAGTLSAEVGFYRLLRQYREEILPPGDFIGWSPADLSPYHYKVELLDVKLGEGDVDEVAEFGRREPFMLERPLTLVFKLVQEVVPPPAVLTLLGY